MSLPMVRARRKKVPSSQRSPCSMTRSHSATESVNPSVVMSQAVCSSATSHSSLTRRISETTRAKSLSRVWSAATSRSTVSETPRWTRVLPLRPRSRSRSSMWRTSSPRESEISLQRRAATGPQLAVLPVAEELVGVSLGAGAGVEDGLAVLDDEHGVAGLVAAEVGVGGVGAEPVVGVVGTHLVGAGREHQPLARERLREPSGGARPPSGVIGWAGRSSSRSPQPWRMKAE